MCLDCLESVVGIIDYQELIVGIIDCLVTLDRLSGEETSSSFSRLS